jgi:PrtD family type I secretion system ABC transporter
MNIHHRSKTSGSDELSTVRNESRNLYFLVGVFSLFVNILMLSSSIYMLNVYDRVLGSRSVETLIALSGLVGFLYVSMSVLDFIRGRIMVRVGARFQSKLDGRVFSAVIAAASMSRPPAETRTGLRDLEAIQKLITSPAALGMFDLPFMPIFFIGIFMFHSALGWAAVCGAAVLILLTIANQVFLRKPLEKATAASFASETYSHNVKAEAEMIRSLGMQGNTFSRWLLTRNASLSDGMAASDTAGVFTAIGKAFRMFLQSGMLGLGAYLVLQGDMTGGSMIAGTILLGRALAPIESLIGNWPIIQRGREAWLNLSSLLSEVTKETQKTALPRPRAILEAQSLTVVPPGDTQAALRLVSFRIMPGQAVGVIGHSGAGKSTLGKALTGVWKPAGGKIRLDGAPLEHYDIETLGEYIGYLPQRVQMFDGTIKENIAKMSLEPDDAAVVRAAQKAGAHEMILKLPEGYDTVINNGGGRLSGGQLQRIGLARAMYGEPVILVLDEPNSNLDADGSDALNASIASIKAEGCSIIIIAHRPAAIQHCDMLLVMENGAVRAFGPKDEVLRNMVRNHEELQRPSIGEKS